MSFAQRRLAFDPARDGFSFANSFRWTPADLDLLAGSLRPVARASAVALPAAGGGLSGGGRGFVAGAAAGLGLAGLGVGQGLVRATARRWPTFGLCGGMALAAAERWPLAAGLPTSELQAKHVRPLLWRRQFQTLRASAPTFARHWLAARLGRSASAATVLREWRRIRQGIDAERPVVVGLVGDAPDPFAQHQVLAFGYAGTDDRGTVFVYDPNAPGEERMIAFTLSGRHVRITTDLPVGPTTNGGVHIHSEPGRLAAFFTIDA